MVRRVVLVLGLLAAAAAKCGTHATCGECAGQKDGLFSCVWCVGQDACALSTQVDCDKTSQIKSGYDCPASPEPGYEYNETLARSVAIIAAAASNGGSNSEIQTCLSRIDSTLYKNYVVDCDSSGDSCAGYLGYSARENLILVVFRGSNGTDQFIQEGANFLLNKFSTMPLVGGKVTQYFYNAWNSVFSAGMETDYKALILQYPNAGTLFIGHSLGGSMASVAAAYSVKKGYTTTQKAKLITFGEPRTGDETYAQNHDALLKHRYRLVHNHDPIPHMPAHTIDGLLDNPYHHRFEVWYENDMTPGQAYVLCPRADDDACSNSVSNNNAADHVTYFNHDLSTWYQTGCA